MKQKLHKFTRLLFLGSSDPRVVFSIFLLLAAFITRNKDYKSSINKMTAGAIIIVIIVSFLAYAELYPYYNSGWKELQKQYPFNTELEYQENQVVITIIKPNEQKRINQYNVKIRLDEKGLAFKPVRYSDGDLSSGVTITHKPVFIPWNKVQGCIKVEYYNSYDKNASYKVRLKIENVDSLIELSVWEFFDPLCKQYNIQIFE